MVQSYLYRGWMNIFTVTDGETDYLFMKYQNIQMVMTVSSVHVFGMLRFFSAVL